MGHGAGGVGDDERVAGIGLGLTGVQVGCLAHRQAWQIGDTAPVGTGHGHGQGADGVGLVDDQQHTAVLFEFVEQGGEVGFVLRQAFVVEPGAVSE